MAVDFPEAFFGQTVPHPFQRDFHGVLHRRLRMAEHEPATALSQRAERIEGLSGIHVAQVSPERETADAFYRCADMYVPDIKPCRKNIRPFPVGEKYLHRRIFREKPV